MPEQNVKDEFKNFAKPKNVVEIWTGYRRINARIEITNMTDLRHLQCRIANAALAKVGGVMISITVTSAMMKKVLNSMGSIQN